MNIIDIINKTKRAVPLSDEEIEYVVNGYTNGDIPDYQMSAWLMAVCLNGLNDRETFALTKAMRDSGDILDIADPRCEHESAPEGKRQMHHVREGISR